MVQALIGRNCYMQGDYKKATEALEKAFAGDPQNSEYALWLGRSFRPARRNLESLYSPRLRLQSAPVFRKVRAVESA